MSGPRALRLQGGHAQDLRVTWCPHTHEAANRNDGAEPSPWRARWRGACHEDSVSWLSPGLGSQIIHV